MPSVLFPLVGGKAKKNTLQLATGAKLLRSIDASLEKFAGWPVASSRQRRKERKIAALGARKPNLREVAAADLACKDDASRVCLERFGFSVEL